MPGGLFEADIAFPDLSGDRTTDEKLNTVRDYLYMLLEALRWTLRNLSPENFNTQEMEAYFDRLKANVVISNTVITNELYADYGAIADLTVDEVRTDYRRAQRFLAGDLSPLDWLYVHDEEIDFFSSTVRLDAGVPLTEQLHRGGRYFWWTDAARTQMTCLEPTGDPVMVYRYDDLLKGSFRFTDHTAGGVTTKIPTLIFGAGIGDAGDPNKGRGFLYKGTERLELFLHTAYGEDHGVFIGDRYTDVVGLRKTAEMDFSGWDAGGFTETLDGGIVNRYRVTFRGGVPVKITDAEGHETEVVW